MALRLPYGQETTPTVSQRTLASGTGIPMVPSVHSIQEGPRGQTTRLHCQPTESIMPRRGKYREYREKPSRGNTEKSLRKRQRIHI